MTIKILMCKNELSPIHENHELHVHEKKRRSGGGAGAVSFLRRPRITEIIHTVPEHIDNLEQWFPTGGSRTPWGSEA